MHAADEEPQPFWFFIAVWLTISITLGVFMSSSTALILAFIAFYGHQICCCYLELILPDILVEFCQMRAYHA